MPAIDPVNRLQRSAVIASDDGQNFKWMHSAVCTVCFVHFLTGGTANGCTLQPEFLPQEFASEGISLGNILNRADRILLGKFHENKDADGFDLKISQSFKPKNIIPKRETVKVSFRDVSHYYMLPGTNYNARSKTKKLLEFAQIVNSDLSTGSKPTYGVGGPIAGIFHGSDCERSVIAYQDQHYLVFIDENNYVISNFPMETTDDDAIINLLRFIDRTFTENFQ